MCSGRNAERAQKHDVRVAEATVESVLEETIQAS